MNDKKGKCENCGKERTLYLFYRVWCCTWCKASIARKERLGVLGAKKPCCSIPVRILGTDSRLMREYSFPIPDGVTHSTVEDVKRFAFDMVAKSGWSALRSTFENGQFRVWVQP